jgi:tol-pal system protein YbgF
MFKRLTLGLLLVLVGFGLLFSFPGIDKKEKAYELMYKDIQILKKKIIELEEQNQRIQDNINAVIEKLQELSQTMQALRTAQTKIQNEQEKIPSQYQILLEKFDSMTQQISGIAEDLLEIKRGPIPSASQEEQPGEAGETASNEEDQSTQVETEETGSQSEPLKPPLDPSLSPQEVYNLARSDYLKGNYELAIEGFAIYIDHFPESPLADNALYWIGECYFSQQEFEEAIVQFNQLILRYPDGDKIPAAYLKKGISLMELDKKEDALAVFRLLITKFPLEEETRIAQQKIKEIDISNERCK